MQDSSRSVWSRSVPNDESEPDDESQTPLNDQTPRRW